MKNLFPGYYRPTGEEFDTLWNECIFVFDTNVLLNLYRLKPETTEQFIEVLERYKDKDRIWIPNRVALEFLDNRLGVISKQADAYNQVIQKAGQIKTQLQNELQLYQKHAFIDIDKVFDNVWRELDVSIAQLKEQKKDHPKLLDQDPILEKIAELFDGRIGDSLTEEKLLQLYQEAERRYSVGIPPGYTDDHKNPSKKYGDYIIWYEMKEFAKKENKSIIFVTDDSKEDWWHGPKGKRVGPRPELINEINRHSNQQFYMYRQDRFTEYAQEKLGIKKDEAIIEEIEAVQSRHYDLGGYDQDILEGQPTEVDLNWYRDQLGGIAGALQSYNLQDQVIKMAGASLGSYSQDLLGTLVTSIQVSNAQALGIVVDTLQDSVSQAIQGILAEYKSQDLGRLPEDILRPSSELLGRLPEDILRPSSELLGRLPEDVLHPPRVKKAVDEIVPSKTQSEADQASQDYQD